MSMFKIKPDKSKNDIETSTLDEVHKKMVANFQKRKKYLPRKKLKLKQLENQLLAFDNMDKTNYSFDDISKRSGLRSEITELRDEIYDIEHNISEQDYYYKTESILMEYYEIMEHDDHILYEQNPDLHLEKVNDKNNSSEEMDQLTRLNRLNKSKKKAKKPTKRRKNRFMQNQGKDILDLLTANDTSVNQQQEEEETVKSPEESTKIGNNSDDSPHSPSLREEAMQNHNKAQLLDQFMSLVSSDYVNCKRQSKSPIRRCEECGIDKTLIHSESIFVCRECGEVEMVIMDNEKPNYKDAGVTDSKPGYPYKRINHFNEWLSQFQAEVNGQNN